MAAEITCAACGKDVGNDERYWYLDVHDGMKPPHYQEYNTVGSVRLCDRCGNIVYSGDCTMTTVKAVPLQRR